MRHLETLAHLFLLLGMSTGAVAIYRLRFDSSGQFLVILTLIVFYLIWGFVYHHLRGDLSRKLFLEYMLIAAIAAAASFLVFAR